MPTVNNISNNDPPVIFVTGANGFVGKALVHNLVLRFPQKKIIAATRLTHSSYPSGVTPRLVESIDQKTDWGSLYGVEVVVHCAARVHVMKDTSADPLGDFRLVNAHGTAALARQAAAAGVRRFVFLSSIKVNGESTTNGRSFNANDDPNPEDPYGISKYEAEQMLRQIASDTGMEVVSIRPPLVYGPGVKANFAFLMRLLAWGVPLPLAAVTQNRRSFVALDNLVDLIVTCMHHPAAANQTFLVSDGEDLSTAELLRRMGTALHRPARLFYVPQMALKIAARVVRRPGVYQRLCGSLQLDINKTRELLDWNPSLTVDEALRRAAQGFRKV